MSFEATVNWHLPVRSAASLLDEEPVAIREDASVERALDEYFLRYRWPWFPVVDDYQRFLGLVERGAADAVPEPVRASSTVREVFEADSTGTLRVRDDAPLESLLGNDALRRLGALMAVDADTRRRGPLPRRRERTEDGRRLLSAGRGMCRRCGVWRMPALCRGDGLPARQRLAGVGSRSLQDQQSGTAER